MVFFERKVYLILYRKIMLKQIYHRAVIGAKVAEANSLLDKTPTISTDILYLE